MNNFIFDIDKSGKPIIQSNNLESVRLHFSAKDKLSKIKKLKYGGYIPTRKYAITPTGRFQFGMFYNIYDFIVKSGMKYNIVLTEKFKKRITSGLDYETVDQLNLPLREYQETTIKKCLKHGNGTSVIATAGGKTLTMATLIHNVYNKSQKPHRTLVIVPGIQLVEQTYADFIEYGIKQTISKWSGDNKLDPNSEIVIASSNILVSKTTTPDMYSDYDLLICDEAHKVRSGNKINKIIDKIKTPIRYGFTGTLPEDKVDEWNVIGKFGPILIEKNSDELRKDKYICDAYVQVIRINYAKPYVYKNESTFLDPTARFTEEIEHLNNNDYRNTVIAKLASRVANNILIVIDRVEHGEILYEYCKKHAPDKKVYFIQGSVSVEDRELMRDFMEKEDNVICIAISSIFSTGINIKNLHYVMFAAGGKAKVRIIQTIGRGLRLNENKNLLTILDITDNLEYAEKHFEKRALMYKKEHIKYGIKEIKES